MNKKIFLVKYLSVLNILSIQISNKKKDQWILV